MAMKKNLIVRAALREGWGVEDIFVMYRIWPSYTRRMLSNMRANGTLHMALGLAMKPEPR
jgi:hypothetical protein